MYPTPIEFIPFDQDPIFNESLNDNEVIAGYLPANVESHTQKVPIHLDDSTTINLIKDPDQFILELPIATNYIEGKEVPIDGREKSYVMGENKYINLTFGNKQYRLRLNVRNYKYTFNSGSKLLRIEIPASQLANHEAVSILDNSGKEIYKYSEAELLPPDMKLSTRSLLPIGQKITLKATDTKVLVGYVISHHPAAAKISQNNGKIEDPLDTFSIDWGNIDKWLEEGILTIENEPIEA